MVRIDFFSTPVGWDHACFSTEHCRRAASAGPGFHTAWREGERGRKRPRQRPNGQASGPPSSCPSRRRGEINAHPSARTSLSAWPCPIADWGARPTHHHGGTVPAAKRRGARIRTGFIPPTGRLCPGSGRMPSIAAGVNGGVSQRYPPNPALIRNETPGFPHGSATNDRNPKLKVKSQERQHSRRISSPCRPNLQRNLSSGANPDSRQMAPNQK